jgi:hypothetical protein
MVGRAPYGAGAAFLSCELSVSSAFGRSPPLGAVERMTIGHFRLARRFGGGADETVRGAFGGGR